MNITKNGITVTIADDEVMKMALERLSAWPSRPIEPGGTVLPQLGETVRFLQPAPPRIGSIWEGQGGIYAGLVRWRDGGSDYHLIVGPENESDLGWDAANDWAKGLKRESFSDYDAGYRSDHSVAFGNVPELFKKVAYWTREQHASSSDDAWVQSFSNGYQIDWDKDVKLRARAFRRILIQ
jgi:hypothetical protein